MALYRNGLLLNDVSRVRDLLHDVNQGRPTADFAHRYSRLMCNLTDRIFSACNPQRGSVETGPKGFHLN